MDYKKIVNIFRQGNLVIPLYLLQNYKKLKISLDEFLFLMYCYNQGEPYLFNPEKICHDLSLDITKVMGYVSSLGDAHLLSVDTVKNEKGLSEDIINLDNFYNRLTAIMTDTIVKVIFLE